MSILGRLKMIFSPIKKRIPPSVREQASGAVYDLSAIFQELNHAYFEGGLCLEISWFGRQIKSRRINRKVLGYYDEKHKRIKIHKSLDHGFFPPFFVSYVIYHEMLHSIEPPKMGRGRRSVHHAAFRRREKEFKEYAEAKAWEKENILKILSGGETYGRS